MNKHIKLSEESEIMDAQLKALPTDIINSISWKTEDKENHAVFFLPTSDLSKEKLKKLMSDHKHNVFISRFNSEVEIPELINLSSRFFFQLSERWSNRLYKKIDKVKFVGVTGTNGKTSTVHFLSQLLVAEKLNVLSYGTLGVFLNGKKVYASQWTTPPYLEIRKIIDNIKDGLDIVLMEVSSHALEQERLKPLRFDHVAWTSFSQDHLDYHLDMDRYFEAKRLIFSLLKPDGYCFILNDEEEILRKIGSNEKIRDTILLSKDSPWTKDTNSFLQGVNRRNFSLALSLAETITNKKINILNVQPVPGRFEIIKANNAKVIIDYAHTPDALENLLLQASSDRQDQILIVFGCGGDRDKSKRPKMGAIAEKYCHQLILTNDNPRHEDPLEIAEQIQAGITDHSKVRIILDREQAIKQAILERHEFDFIIIAGKGDEEEISIKGRSYPFSDRKIVQRYLSDI